jgi:hypothetical protein
MSKYHYEINIDLEKLSETKDGSILAEYIFGAYCSKTVHLHTNNQLIQNELLAITGMDGGAVNLKLTKITRYLFQLNDEDNLIEMDMTHSFKQDDRPVNKTDEVWFSCEAIAVLISD